MSAVTGQLRAERLLLELNSHTNTVYKSCHKLPNTQGTLSLPSNAHAAYTQTVHSLAPRSSLYSQNIC